MSASGLHVYSPDGAFNRSFCFLACQISHTGDVAPDFEYHYGFVIGEIQA